MYAAEMRRRGLEGFAHYGIEAVISGQKVESTMLSKEMRAVHLAQIYFKYHLTPRQHIQLNQIVWDIANGKKVLYVAPRPAGQATVYRAAKEILKLLKLPANHLKKHETN